MVNITNNVSFFCSRISIFHKNVLFFIKNNIFISSVISGLIAKPAFTSAYFFPFLILSFELFFVVLQGLYENKKYSSCKKILFAGYIYGFFLYAGILYWETYLHDLDFTKNNVLNFFYTYFFYFLGIIYEAFYYSFATFLSVKLSKSKTTLLFYFAIFITLAEMLNSYIFKGYPFTIVGYGTIGIPYFSNIASIFGSYGVTFLFIFILAMLNLKKYWKFGLFLYFIIFSYNFYNVNLRKKFLLQDNKFEVTVVEPNFDHEQRSHGSYKKNCNKIAELADINRHIQKDTKRLIITPETIIQSKDKHIKYFSESIAKNKNIYVLTGFLEAKKIDDNYKIYNSMHIYNDKGESIAEYQKRHLLTFSETFPSWIFKFKGICTKNISNMLYNMEKYGGLTPGDKSNSVKISGIDQFAMNICYDIICPGYTMSDPLLSTWILNIINLHCYCSKKVSDIAHQQNVICRFRAMEYGKPVVVCANYGISCIIDCNGNIIKSLKANQSGALHQKFPLKYKITMFCIYGNNLILIILIIFLTIILLFEYINIYERYKRLKNKKNEYTK